MHALKSRLTIWINVVEGKDVARHFQRRHARTFATQFNRIMKATGDSCRCRTEPRQFSEE